jgi:hypothetical protein
MKRFLVLNLVCGLIIGPSVLSQPAAALAAPIRVGHKHRDVQRGRDGLQYS